MYLLLAMSKFVDRVPRVAALEAANRSTPYASNTNFDGRHNYNHIKQACWEAVAFDTDQCHFLSQALLKVPVFVYRPFDHAAFFALFPRPAKAQLIWLAILTSSPSSTANA